MMGLGKGSSLLKWQFLVSMLDFWGVTGFVSWVISYITSNLGDLSQPTYRGLFYSS